MASLVTTADKLNQYLGIGKAASAKVYAYQPVAEKDLRALLTDAVYDALVADLPGNDVDALSAARAECLLALHHSITILGFRVVDDGGLAKHFGMGEYAGELLSPFQIGQLKRTIHAQALEAIRHKIPANAIDGTIFKTQDDLDAQFQGNGFGLTAVGPNPEAGVLNNRTGVYE